MTLGRSAIPNAWPPRIRPLKTAGRVLRVALGLLRKRPIAKDLYALIYGNPAVRAVRFMNEPQAADYLNAKSDALKYVDKEKSREQGMKQFLDDKTYRPGLGHFKRQKAK